MGGIDKIGKIRPGTSRAPELTTEIAALTFKYTIGGQVARRTDPRGVTLDFPYGTCAAQTAGEPILPVKQVTGVEVACPSPLPVDRSLADTVDYLTHDCDTVGRRVPKTVGTGDDPTDYFYYDGHRALEHHTNDGTALTLHRRYVYRLDYIDEVVAYQSTVRFGVAGPPFHPLLPRGEGGGLSDTQKPNLLYYGLEHRAD